MKVFASLLLVGLSLSSVAQDHAYRIFDSKGKKVSFKKMVKKLDGNDVVLFGEYHNNPISHWLEYEYAKAFIQQGPSLFAAEMFERDNNDELQLYMQDSITAKSLDTVARLWNNFKTDYKPLVDLAKDSGVGFVAANIPRRYANKVYKGGFTALDSLTDEEKSWIAPLPIEFDSTLPQYQAILAMMGGHGSPRIVKAQAIKDATMAWFILSEGLQKNPDVSVLHFNGAFHSDFYEGIGWYLKQYKPDVEVGAITTVSQADVNKLAKEHRGRADFIIVVDEDMTTTY